MTNLQELRERQSYTVALTNCPFKICFPNLKCWVQSEIYRRSYEQNETNTFKVFGVGHVHTFISREIFEIISSYSTVYLRH